MPIGLKEIIEHKRAELAVAMQKQSFAELEAMVAMAEPVRNFFAAVTHHPDAFHSSVIAEVRRKSPTSGDDVGAERWLRPEYAHLARPGAGVTSGGFDPGVIAKRYADNGAAAISVATDETFFGGRLGFIERVKESVPLPVLRRDFIIDPWQLWESRAAGADAVLLIAECLPIADLVDMLILAQRLQLTTLLEVHSVDSLLRVRPHVGFPHPSYFLLGINNRDLDVPAAAPEAKAPDVNTTLRLLDMVENPSILVSESGIASASDVTWLRHHGVKIVLMGDELMRADDPGRALAEVLGREVR